jgi:hypothetical protein
MFNLIEPGHVLRFGVDPITIVSPKGGHDTHNDNTLESRWSTTSNLGTVQCISHPSGDVGDVAADVATHLRGANSKSRSASYSGVGRAFTSSNRVVGSVHCDFTGYTDGKSCYIPTNNAALSKDFSGCLFVLYSVGGERRVAHVASSQVPKMDCKQAFLDTLHAKHVAHQAVLHGWFRPYVSPADDGQKINEFQLISSYVNNTINNLVTFGVIMANGSPYSINAFKPYKMAKMAKGLITKAGHFLPGNDWIVTSVTPKQMSQNWNV